MTKYYRHVLDRNGLLALSALTLSLMASVLSVLLGAGNTLAVVIIVCVIIFLVRKPQWALAVKLAGFYYYPVFFPLFFEVLGISMSPITTFAYYSILSIAYLSRSLGAGRHRLKILFSMPSAIALAAFSLWTVVNAALLSQGSSEALDKIVFTLLLMWFPLVGAFLLSESQRRSFLLTCGILGMGGLVVAVSSVTTGAGPTLSRLTISSNTNPLNDAYLLGISALAVLVYAISGTTKKLWLLIALQFAATAVFIVLSGSRGPVIALSAALLVVALRQNLASRLRLALIASGAFVLMLVAADSTVAGTVNRFTPILELAASPTTVLADENALQLASSGRWLIWRDAMTQWGSSPWIGIGLGNFSSGNIIFAHNFLLEVGVETGIVGLVLFAAFSVLMLRDVLLLLKLKEPNRYITFSMALLMYGLVQITFSGRIQTATPFWVACGLIMALSANSKSAGFDTLHVTR